MGKPITKQSTNLTGKQVQIRQLSPLRYIVRWLYRIVFIFIGTTIVATIIQTIATLQGASLTLSSLQDFFFVKLILAYPLLSLLISLVVLTLGIGGFVTDRMLSKEEKVEAEEEMKNMVKEGITEAFEFTVFTGTPLSQLGGLRSWWGEIPNIPSFVGRQQFLDDLIDWTINKSCRLIAVLGFGGIGKTSLVAKFAEQVKDKFECVYWRSVQNAPSFSATLSSMLQLVTKQQHVDLPDDEDEQILLLIHYLKNHRCLLILDNWETLLSDGDRTGQYHIGFEAYGNLLRRLAETDHRSCLILTSREKPRGFSILEVNSTKVYSLLVKGLQVSESQLTLANEDLIGSTQDWESLIQLYAGNPLYLKLAAELIQKLFGGQISKFLETGERVFGSLLNPVEIQFNRLSSLEQDVMYWLAIEREATSLDGLGRDLAGQVSKREILTVLETLHHRSIIETSSPQFFTLQPVVLEYVTVQFIEKVIAEIIDRIPVLFASHPLIKAQAKDYVRNSQIQLLLKPITEQLLANLGKTGLEIKLKDILVTLRAKSNQQQFTYIAGNILNLLIQAHSDLRGYDFSHLTIRQAYLQGVAVPEINFAFSKLEESVFTDTFGGVLSLTHNPQGSLLVAGTTTGEIRLWQLPDGRPLRTLQGHTDWVMSVKMSSDGTRLVSGSEDLTIRVWDINSGQCLQIMEGHENWVRCIALHPEGNLVASAGEDGATKIWDVATGKCLTTLPEQTSSVWSVAFSPDGKFLANSSGDSTIRIWDVATWQSLYTLDGHTARVWCVTFSPDGHYLASSSQDKTVRIWDMEQHACLHTLTGHANHVWSVNFSPDGRTIVSTSEDQTARIWRSDTFELLNVLQGHTDRVWSTIFTQDGKLVITASQDQSIRFWDIVSGQHMATLRGYTNPVNAITFHPSLPLLAAATSEQTIHIWDINTNQLHRVLRGHTRAVRAVAFSPNGHLLASGCEDHAIRLWNIQTGACLEVLDGHHNWVWSVAFNSKGNLLASGSMDGTIRIWEIQSKYHTKCIQVLSDCGERVWSVAFSPDGTKLAAGSGDGAARIWDVTSWCSLHVLQSSSSTRVASIAFNSIGNCLATCSQDHTVSLWDTETGLLISTLRGHTRPIWSIAFNYDGTILATSSGDRTVRLWMVETQQSFAELQGHTNPVVSVQFGLGNHILASGSEDGTVRLWNYPAKECTTVLSSARPYEQMDITGVYGITPAEKAALHALGAIEHHQ